MAEELYPAADTPAAWVAADWGTSNLRLWVMSGDDRVLARIEDPRGMSALSSDGFEPVLRECLAPWLGTGRRLAAVACGMVGARQGWVEAPYLPTPGQPVDMARLRLAPVSSDDLDVTILPGMAQAEPADVMRGEETQVAGHLAAEPQFDGLICLPGTHTKWVRCRNGRVERFRTCMTGELFALLAGQSVLRHALAGADWDDHAFVDAARDAARHCGAMIDGLFGIRAASLLKDTPAAQSRARLSGLLIGAEIGTMRGEWHDRPIAVIGSERLARLYARALADQGAEVAAVDAETATLRGLMAVHAQLTTEAT